MLTYLHVRAISARAVKGRLSAGILTVPCILGRSGMSRRKREGDGATPVGCFSLRQVLYRRDRIMIPRAGLPVRAIGPGDGWCDASGDRNYNRLVRMPYGASHEVLSRRDRLYDIVVVLSHNEQPRIQGLGCAVFFHLKSMDGGPTAGCIAISLGDMRKILALCGPRTRLAIWPSSGLALYGFRKSPSRFADAWRHRKSPSRNRRSSPC